MNRIKCLIVLSLVLTSTLVGCLGGVEEFDTTQLDEQITNLQKNQDEMNQTIVEHRLANTELQLIIDLLNQQIEDYQSNISYLENKISDIETIVNLSGADLTGADLTGTNLAGANLSEIRAINLLGCPALLPTDWKCVNDNIVGPNSNLNNVDLSFSNLTYVDLSYADLSYADLRYAQLVGADLSNTDLSNANMYVANLFEADLTGADLAGAELNYVRLDSTILSNADMKYVDLRGSDLNNANLSNVDLSYADLTGAILKNTNLNNVIWYDTICPDGTNSNDNGNVCGYVTTNDPT